MAISKKTKQFLDLINRSNPILDGWRKVSSTLFVFVQNQALDIQDLVEFNFNRDRVAFIRFTEKGKKYIKDL